MASSDESGDLPAEDQEDDLEPSRFLPDDRKPAGLVQRLKQNRFFVIFVTCSVLFHAGLIWLAQSFDMPSIGGQPGGTEIPVDLVNEEEAQKGGAGAGGAKHVQTGDFNKDTKANATEPPAEPAKQEAAKQEPPKQDPPKQELPKQEPPKQEPPKQDAPKQEPPKEKPPEPKAEKPPEPPVKPAEQKPEEKKKAEANPPAKKADAPDKKMPIQNEAAKQGVADEASKADEQQVANQGPASPQPSSQYNLPMIYRPEDPLSLKIPAPLPTNEPEAEQVSYKLIVFSMIQRAVSARERHSSGSVGVAFAIDDEGQPQNVEMTRSSGDTNLDAEGLAMITRAAPFPPPPVGAQRFFVIDIGFSSD